MAAPTYIGNGTRLSPANRTNSVVDAPESVATGDIILVFLYIEILTAPTLPSGFTEIQTPLGTNSNTIGRVYWKRAVGDGTDDPTDTYTFTHANAFTEAVAINFRGCVVSGSPVDVSNFAKNDTASTTTPGVTVTTTGVDRLLVWFATSVGTGSWTPEASPVAYTERYDFNPSELCVATVGQAAAGSSGTINGTGPSGKMTAGLIALLPAVTVLTVTGIGSGQAFGTTVVTPGAVTLGTSGIVSAEAFGASQVIQIISPVGIPSAEAFGLADLTGGIRPMGIPSVEAFGTATVVPGDVTLTVSSISNGEVFGSAEILGSVIAPISIPSGEAFGTAVITTGPVDIFPSGIPSQFEFGNHEVAQFVTALRSEILVRPKPRTTYEVVWMAKIPQASGPPKFFAIDPLEWTDISYTEQLSAIPTLDFTCQISTITDAIRQRFRTPSEMTTEIWVYRNGKIIFAGPLAGATVQGEDLNFTVDGLMSYLNNMLITQDTIFKAADQFSIVKSLVDTKQAGSYGNYGILTSNIGLSGITLDMTYLKQEGNYVLPRIQDLGKAANGFDITINSSSRSIELYHPYMGVDRSVGPESIVFDDKDITDTNLILSLAPKDLASDIHAIGTGTGQDGAEVYYSTLSNEALLTQYGRSELELSFRDISSQAQLDALVLAASQARVKPLWIPGPNVRVTPNADLSAYNVGDTVFYRLHHNLEVQGAFRLLKRTIRVSGGGDETVSAAFV